MDRRSASGARWTLSSGSVLRESLNQPLIVIFEDLHWVDGRDARTSESARRNDRQCAHILMLVNYRPEYSSRLGQ